MFRNMNKIKQRVRRGIEHAAVIAAAKTVYYGQFTPPSVGQERINGDSTPYR